MHTMPRGKLRPTLEEVKALLAADRDFLRPIVEAVLQELLEVEMTEALGAAKGERTAARLGYRSGYYGRTLVTRVGKLELRVPQDRQGRFSTELFERYQRSEKALVAALAEMDVQGVSTRKVKAITEELCGPSFSAAAISAINARLDEACPYLIVDARYERVREAGVIRSQAVLLAIGIGWDGRRSILAVELANRESRSSWREFLLQLRERGLSGVEFVVSDDHAGLRQAIVEVLPEAAWQRCYVHFLRNALDYVPRKVPPWGAGSPRPRKGRLPARAPLALPPARSRRGQPGSGSVARQVAGHLPQALRLGRGAHRGDADLLPAAAPAP
jgi:transposase-like protein